MPAVWTEKCDLSLIRLKCVAWQPNSYSDFLCIHGQYTATHIALWISVYTNLVGQSKADFQLMPITFAKRLQFMRVNNILHNTHFFAFVIWAVQLTVQHTGQKIFAYKMQKQNSKKKNGAEAHEYNWRKQCVAVAQFSNKTCLNKKCTR